MTRASDTARLLGAGATILDGTTISTADNTAQLILQSTDTDASSGPQLTLKRDSSSPADDDFVGRVKYIAENDASQEVTYVDLLSRIKDASDGTEDGEFQIKTMVAGSDLTNFKITSSGLNSVPEIVFNDDSADINFRVESNGQANMLFVDGGEDIVSIGGGASYTVGQFKNTLQIEGTDGTSSSMSITRNTAGTSPPYLQFAKTRGSSVGANTVVQDGDDLGIITWNGADGTDRNTNAAMIKCEVDGTPGGNDMPGRLIFKTTADGASATSERMRITAAGDLLIGKTSTSIGTAGHRITSSAVSFVRDGGGPFIANRLSSHGDIVEIYSQSSLVGTIGSGTGRLVIRGTNGSTGSGIQFDINQYLPTTHAGALVDDTISLGTGSYRFDNVFATSGSINTSDKNEKQDIEELTDAEKRVAVVAKGLMRKFRWKSAVAEKGDKARTHFGIMAQDLQDAFTAESLDASKYGMFCSDTWWDKEITVAAVEAKDAVYKEVTDEDGVKTNELVSAEVEAKDAYTYTDTKQEATEGYTEKTRLGVRYSELLAFIISAI